MACGCKSQKVHTSKVRPFKVIVSFVFIHYVCTIVSISSPGHFLVLDNNNTTDVMLSIGSYNVHGINSNKWEYIHNQMHLYDFFLVQEHWLHSSQSHLFEDNISDVSVHCVSGMSDAEFIRGRPYGGCCIMWRRSLTCTVTPIISNNNRLCMVKVKLNSDTLLICTLYMPCDTNYDHVNDALFVATLGDIAHTADNENANMIICGGDFNCNMTRNKSLHTRSLQRFLDSEHCLLLDDHDVCHIDFTFESYG